MTHQSQDDRSDPVDKMLRVFEEAVESTAERIDKRITELTDQVAKLKRMRAAIAKTAGVSVPNQRTSGAIDEGQEQSIVDLVTKRPMAPRRSRARLE